MPGLYYTLPWLKLKGVLIVKIVKFYIENNVYMAEFTINNETHISAITSQNDQLYVSTGTAIQGNRQRHMLTEEQISQYQNWKNPAPQHPLFAMSFSALCKHFEANHNPNPCRTGKIIGRRLFEASTVRNEFMRWVSANGFPYLDNLGRFWFCMDGNSWTSYDYEVENGIITFFEMK